MITGDYMNFWGSLEWQIKIDFEKQTLDKYYITFRNKSTLENTFEVKEICEVSKLLLKFTTGWLLEKTSQKLAITRLGNFLSEYLQKYGAPFSPRDIIKCLRKPIPDTDKVDVIVKKMTFTDQITTNSINFNPDDLKIDFNSYYESLPATDLIISYSVEDEDEIDHKAIIAEVLNDQIPVVIKYFVQGELIEIQNSLALKIPENLNFYKVSQIIHNTQLENFKDIIIKVNIKRNLKVIDVIAKLMAPDSSELGNFQPVDIQIEKDNTLTIIWKINELKPKHSIEFNYTITKRLIESLIIKREQNCEELMYFHDPEVNDDKTTFISIPKIKSFADDNPISTYKSLIPLEISLEIDSDLKQKIHSTRYNKNYREIIWDQDFIQLYADKSFSFSGSILENEELLVEIEKAKFNELIPPEGTDLGNKVQESQREEVVDQDLVELTETDEFFMDSELQDVKIPVTELTPEDSKYKVSPDNPIILYSSTQIIESNTDLQDLTLFIRLYVPTGERFIVILLNPYEMVSCYIQGGKSGSQDFRNFKLPLIRIKGKWLLKVQFLEKQIGLSQEYSLFVK